MLGSSLKSPSVQVGIFTNELCIVFRDVMEQILCNFVNRMYITAKDFQRSKGGSLDRLFRISLGTVNTWDIASRDRYQAQVISTYKHMSDLYKNIYLMFIGEMYSQALGKVSVSVNIPSIGTMLYTFLRLACAEEAILRGEYNLKMSFAEKIFLVESLIRRMLYELVVQQNNVKGISVKHNNIDTSQKQGYPVMTIQKEDEIHSHDISVGHPHIVPTTTPDIRTTNQSSHSIKLQTKIPPLATQTAVTEPLTSNKSNNSSMASALSLPLTGTSSRPTQPLQQMESTNTIPPMPMLKEPSITSYNTQQPNPQLEPQPEPQLVSQPEPQPELQSNLQPNSQSNSKPNVNNSSTAPIEKPSTTGINSEPKSIITAHKPAGAYLPDPIPINIRQDNDSLDLPLSDQEFMNEVHRILEATNTLTPSDSVSNLAANSRNLNPITFPPISQ